MQQRWIASLVAGVALLALLALPRSVLAGSEQLPVSLVGTEMCLECHEPDELGDMHNVHLRIESFEVQGATVGCEGCHGPGEAHVEEGDPEFIRTFTETSAETSEVCLSCHRGKHLTQWPSSLHASEGVGCLDCHSIHETADAMGSCNECHAEAVAQFRLPSRHPVPEGKMDCASCHDVHAATEAMLVTRQRTNDLCFTCHQAKEGPFIFEHAPVQEDCSTCHVAHGSVAKSLLTANEPMLCLQCHDFHFHAGYQASDSMHVDVGGIERENPMGPGGFNIAFTTSCTQCHSQVHGSDTPSQTVTSQGRGLTQ